MTPQYIAKRAINDYLPLRKKVENDNGVVKDISSDIFVFLCEMFYVKKISNLQFKNLLGQEINKCNYL